MKMKSILLCALALGGICAFGDGAKETANVGEGKELVGGYTWSYSIRGGGASIEASGGKYVCAVSPSPEGDVVIPAKLGGVAVTRIGRAAFTRCRSMTAVTIPSTVTSIGKSAFYECGIRSVTIPRGVKSIEDLAFYHSSLKSVIIPEGVTNIGGSAFGDCWGIESVTIPSSVTSIGRRAFSCDSRRMNSIVVSPNNKKFAVYDNLLCTKDGKSVIAGIGGDVTIPSSVTSIDEYAFYKCRGLTSVTIPSSVTMIGNSAFEWCEGIESFHVSPENRAFASPNGILCSKDGKTVIAGVNGDVVIPDGVTRIDESAFTGRRWLTSVKIPASVKIIGDEVFRCCKGLVSVTMCGERPRATRGVFDYCEKLKAIHVPADSRSWEGLKTWQGIPLVFDGEKSVVGQVKCVDVGGSSTSKRTPGENLVAQKLRKCNFLLNKNFKKDAKFYLCLFSASWCPPCRAEMPRIAKTYAETLKDDPDIELIHFSRDQNDEKALAWAKEHDVKFPVVKPKGGNPLDLHSRGIPHLFIVRADGTLVEEGHPMRIFNEEKLKELKGAKPACGTKLQVDKGGDGANGCTEKVDGYTWSYRVNNGEAEIVAEKSGKYSCAVSPKPTGDLAIPSVLGGMKVTSIGQNAFYGCGGLTAVTIPSNVRNIGYDAFFNCSGLTSVTIPDGVTNIGGSAFSQCSGLTSVTIPSSVTSLGGYSFYYCSRLKSVAIPSSVTSIGSGSFNNCRGMVEFVVEEGNPAYCSVGGVLYNKDRTSLIQFPCAKAGTLTIPASVSSIGHGVLLGCRGLLTIDVEEGNLAYCSIDGILYNKERTKLIQCPGGKCGMVRIPEGVTSIGSSGYWAFRECRGLTSVIIPSSVTSIGGLTFLGCSGLTSVTIPSSVMSIGPEAFSGCRGLTTVTMCGECPDARDKVFANCAKLAAIHVPANVKSWTGMKEWQGIPLVFDAETK